MKFVSAQQHGTTSNAKADWINVMDRGAVGDGSTDDTTAIQAALNAAAPSSVTSATSPSNTVYIPPGIFVCGPITIPHRVTLKGSGIGTTRLLCKAGTTTGSTMITNVSTATMIAVRDMTLLGNLGNQSTNIIAGIKFNGSGAGSEYTDMRSQMSHLMVQDFTGDGVTITGRGVCQVSDVQAWNNAGHGFSFSIDSEAVNCDAGQNGKNGFYVTGNTKFTNCKAWFSGWFNSGGGAAVQTTNVVTNNLGNGFHFDGSTSGCVSTGIFAQDNAGRGIYIANSSDRVTITGWASDSNNNNASATSFANVEVTNSFQIIMRGGVSFDRSANTQHPAKALSINSSANNVTVEMKTEGFTGANKVSISGTTYQNMVKVDSSDGSWNAPFSGTVTPDLSNGSYHSVSTMTSSTTIAAPVASFNCGNPLTFRFVQDATGGRTVTWNTTYNSTLWQPNPAPNAVSTVSFTWDANSGFWTQVASAASGQANAFAARGSNVLSALMSGSAFTTTATTATDVTGLSIDNVPAGTYIAEYKLIWKVSVAGDPKFGITGPTLTTLSLQTQWLDNAALTASGGGTLRVTAYGVNAVTGTVSASVDLPFEAAGALVISAAGTVKIQAASPIVTTTLTLEPGSWLRLTPVAS